MQPHVSFEQRDRRLTSPVPRQPLLGEVLERRLPALGVGVRPPVQVGLHLGRPRVGMGALLEVLLTLLALGIAVADLPAHPLTVLGGRHENT